MKNVKFLSLGLIFIFALSLSSCNSAKKKEAKVGAETEVKASPCDSTQKAKCADVAVKDSSKCCDDVAAKDSSKCCDDKAVKDSSAVKSDKECEDKTE